MKRFTFFLGMLAIILAGKIAVGQNQKGNFKMEGSNSQILILNQQITESTEINPFENIDEKIYGMDVKANVKLANENSLVRIILVDRNYNEYLIYETYPLLESANSFSVDNISEETSILDGEYPLSLKIEIASAEVKLHSVSYSSEIDSDLDVEKIKKEKKKGQNEEKINKINNNLKKKGSNWVAGPTAVSELSYSERKQLYGQSTFPAAFEYYAGGVISIGDNLKSASASNSPMVGSWDWRDKHGKNWITPIVNQGACGSCWAFATTGATEAITNLYFNQQLNLDLSEQDVLSCSGAGSCDGGLPSSALNYIANTGVVDENTFPYVKSASCDQKGDNPSQLIKIAGKIDFGSTSYPKTEDDLKRMLIEMGPLSGGLYDWSHAMVLVGYKVVEEGDVFYYRNLDLNRYWETVSTGDPLIGKTVWIFKNSWGPYFGDEGYVFVETSISNIGWTHGLKTPVTSVINDYNVICEDSDGDGYYWWGLGPKPTTPEAQNIPDLPDGDDSDPTLGPLDEYGNCIPLGPVSAPVANFSSDNTNITEGESVVFNDVSTNNPTSWSWSFEGGTPATSTSKDPIITYSTVGDYKVSLIVTNSAGKDTMVVDNYVHVSELLSPPVADFVSDKREISVANSVNFNDNSANNPTSWLWSFEGGNPSTSTSQNPVINYGNPGQYKVVLSAKNADGEDTKAIENYITVIDPSQITYCTVSANSTDEWIKNVEMGPNTNVSGAGGYQDFTSKIFNFESGKTYNITLDPGFRLKNTFEYWAIWIDYNKDKDFDDSNEQIFVSSKSRSTVTGSITIPGNITTDTRMRIAMSRAETPTTCGSIAYGEIEDYSVHIGEPVPQPPIADFTSDKTNILIGESVQFQDLSQNNPTKWQWSFPGGLPESSTAQNPSVIYSGTGEYDVTLTVFDDDLNSSQKIKYKYIVASEQIKSEYCEPVSINSSLDYIMSISVGGILFNSVGDGYSFTDTPISLNAATTYDISLTPKNTKNRNFWRIWIDFNGDGDFDDSDETLVVENNKKGYVLTSLFIPDYATGTTRMRVSMKLGKSPSACDDNFDGEVEDYLVSIQPMQAPKSAFGSDFDSKEIMIYPNPTITILNLRLVSFESGDTYSIYNLDGKVLKSNYITSAISNIDVSQIPPGMYLIVTNNSGEISRQKFIKK